MNQALAAIRTVRLPAMPAWLAASCARERGRGMPWLAVAMGAGAVAFFARTTNPAPWSGPALLLATAVLCALCWRSRARAAAMLLLAGAAGFGSGQWATERAFPLMALPRTATIATGTVRGVEQLAEGRRLTIVDLRLDGGPALPRFVHLRPRPGDAAFATGDTVRFRAVLRPPSAPAFPGGWDLQRDAFFSGLGGGGVALGPVERLAEAAPSRPAQWLQGVRDAVAGRVMAGLSGAPGAIAATLLTGGTGAIPPADRAAFRDSGLAHLLAVAGLHIGIVMGLVMGSVRFGLALAPRLALYWPCKQVAACAALLAGFGYVLMTGAHIPVQRSFAMASLVTLGVAIGRRAISMRGLALAAMALLLVDPAAVMGVSFQMSFAAVLALIAGYEALQPALATLRRRPAASHLVALVLTSLLAGVASAPFAAFHFGHVQAYFILGNLFAVPLAALWIMPWGMVALLLMPLGLERLALGPMGLGIDLVLGIAHGVSALPAATFPVPHLPGWGLAVLSLGLAWLGLWRSRLRVGGLLGIAAGLASPLASPAPDLLVSADARLVAWTPGPFLQTRPGFSHFTLDAWSQYLAVPLSQPFPETGGLCDPDGCRLVAGGATVLLARSGRAMDCAGVVLVVSAEPAAAVCPDLPRIDRFTVWRDGAHAVWLAAGRGTILSDRAGRGRRPWVPPPPEPSRVRTSLPMADRDE